MIQYFCRSPETRKLIHRIKADDHERREKLAFGSVNEIGVLYNQFWKEWHRKRAGYQQEARLGE